MSLEGHTCPLSRVFAGLPDLGRFCQSFAVSGELVALVTSTLCEITATFVPLPEWHDECIKLAC